ncbi:13410_t:CDS:2 [Funneliformis caledonium]|uniref:13410_t:CDS:1 n=1 Tax=Funneliformis caledonium TaxID=1117310 RepID=A0A9N9D2K9_9GLOM|nr:13410_t:CDS:2 [Funneliformis caledonium]
MVMKIRLSKPEVKGDILSYRKFLGKILVSDLIVKGNKEENQHPENVYDIELKCRSSTSQSDNDFSDYEEYQDYKKNVSDYEECFEEEIPSNIASANTIES